MNNNLLFLQIALIFTPTPNELTSNLVLYSDKSYVKIEIKRSLR